MKPRLLALALAALVAAPAIAAPAGDPWHARARDLLEKAVNIPTVPGRERVPELAKLLAGQFRAAGFPDADIHVLPYEGANKDNAAALIVRWRAPGKPTAKPIMVMAHMDVVEAKREDWSESDPFVFAERDGYYYGRGTADIKQGIAATTIAILKLKASGFTPVRDIVVFYTGDEESAGVGANKGATEWKSLLDVEYGLNSDGGGGNYAEDGSVVGFSLQSAEKTYADYTFTARNRGGHSSRPRPDNAIYQLANALHRLETHRFEPALNETTRAYFSERQKSEKGPVGDAMRAWLRNPADGAAADVIEADEREVGLTRTRCVATRLFGGHADNALPQLATATVNCRILPGVDPDAIQAELQRVVADPGVEVTRNDDYVSSLASPLRKDVVDAYTDAVRALHPGAPVMPEMSTGASDARPFRVAGIPIYGVDGSWGVTPIDNRSHGRDERLPVKALGDDVDHWVLMLTRLAGAKQ
jgi:acetylornithine deacetylase/succinyl-diaminopimelate desuccinylase-like protein